VADFGSGYLSSDWGGGWFGDKGSKAGFGSGRAVKLAEGALAGWEGVITEVLPGNETSATAIGISGPRDGGGGKGGKPITGRDLRLEGATICDSSEPGPTGG